MGNYAIRCDLPCSGVQQTNCSRTVKLVTFVLAILLLSIGIATFAAPHVFTLGGMTAYGCTAVGTIALVIAAYVRSIPKVR